MMGAGFKPGYYSDAKPELLELIDPRGLRILDAGCAGGSNGEMMKRRGAREVVGIVYAKDLVGYAWGNLEGHTIHDLLHASFWNIAEENIDQAGYDIARVLWKLGWRKEL